MRDEENIFINESENKKEERIMKDKLLTTLALVVVTVALVTSTARAQTVANGPYYATPSWDQTLPVATRFIVLSNMGSNAVLDRETGLVWERSPTADAISNWFAANGRCLTQTTGNRFGWRLPTINELASLFDPSATTRPFLPSGHPFTGLPVLRGRFWTATPNFFNSGHLVGGYDTDPDGAFLSFAAVTSDSTLRDVWCVRGGLLVGPQQ